MTKPKNMTSASEVSIVPAIDNEYAKIGNIDLKGWDLYRGLDIYNQVMIDNGLPPLSDIEKDVYLYIYRVRTTKFMLLTNYSAPKWLLQEPDALISLQNRFLIFIGKEGKFAAFRPDNITSNFHISGEKLPYYYEVEEFEEVLQ